MSVARLADIEVEQKPESKKISEEGTEVLNPRHVNAIKRPSFQGCCALPSPDNGILSDVHKVFNDLTRHAPTRYGRRLGGHRPTIAKPIYGSDIVGKQVKRKAAYKKDNPMKKNILSLMTNLHPSRRQITS
ncbi:uncharacterized protein CIMG_12621 [Coccidioides immitis RS]|uniref:Uncharacterized protein n=1 Tax=Coccidioides immitis (strain RS) TaxID=246410 RepID=A0A0D8JSI6_COCIM|nr:uncharacterized protein CIMG_12621 [Coccidioides immitis RS]KJF59946.1 hypothetical protein CIMG_12621 [Coccidioides immitis RS]